MSDFFSQKFSQSPYPPYLRVHEPLLTFSLLPLKDLRHLPQHPPKLRRETPLYPRAHPAIRTQKLELHVLRGVVKFTHLPNLA